MSKTLKEQFPIIKPKDFKRDDVILQIDRSRTCEETLMKVGCIDGEIITYENLKEDIGSESIEITTRDDCEFRLIKRA